MIKSLIKFLNLKIYICRPYWKHLKEKFPKNLTHQIHKWSVGIILIDHLEPDGKWEEWKWI